MVNATPDHAWLVVQMLRRLARLPLDQAKPAWPAGDATARLDLNHPQAHPGMASTILTG